MSEKYSHSNPNNPTCWDSKYKNNQAQWDINGPTPIIVDWFKKNPIKKKIIVPGCGYGHDALYLATQGHDVYAVDFSTQAINILKANAKERKINLNILNEDYFKLEKYYGMFDLFLEYTFFCAILPTERKKYIEVSSKLLNRNGLFVGILLPLDKEIEEGGPPFGIELQDTIKLFQKYYHLVECKNSERSIKPRKGKEKFVLFEKCTS